MLLSDRPISTPAEDQLGFQPFCATLAKGLREMAPAEGMVVALHAPWGSGKTSALNLLQHHLAVLDVAELSKKNPEDVAALAAARADAADEAERKQAGDWIKLHEKHRKNLKTTVIRFNPWYFSGQESLFKAFFGVLGTELSVTNNTKVAKAVAAVLKRGDAAGAMLGAAVGLGTVGPMAAAGGATIGGFFGKLVGDKFEQKESLEASLQQLREALQTSERRLLIVVDDIDRLLPEELRQILTLIKSLGNLPNITYLLAFARAEVVDLIKRAGISNADYLEKIVQVSFELPRVDRYALRTMLFARLDATRKSKELKETTRWSRAFFDHIDPYLRTPRDVTRLCNSLQVTWPAVEDEVDWTDLVVLEVLRLHEPDIYDLVLAKLDRLTGETSSFGDDKEWAKDLVPTADNSSEPEQVKKALMSLFPRLAKAWEPNSFSYGKDNQAQRNRRLQCPEYASNYFSLSPASDQFTAAQIKNLFTAVDSREAFDKLFEAAKARKTRRGSTMVCRLLLQIKEEISPANQLPVSLARAILAKADEIVRIRDGERMLFETHNELRLSWVFVEALRALPPDKKTAAAKEWFNEAGGQAFLVEFTSTMTNKNSKLLDAVFKNPLMRSANVISALFHDGVVVTESDNDRAFYSEVYYRLAETEKGLPSLLFVNAQNKQTMRDIIEPLRRFGIPAAAIADIDVVKDGGKTWSGWLKAAQVPDALHLGNSQQRHTLNELLATSGKDMKRDGGIAILSQQDQVAANEFFDLLDSYGVFTVRRGELENWLPTLGAVGKKTDWAVSALEKMGADPTDVSYLKPGQDDVWEFMRKIVAWIKDPSRKGTQ